MLLNTDGGLALQMSQWRKNALGCTIPRESALLLRSQTDEAREILVSSRGPGSLRIRSPAAAAADMGAIHRRELIDQGTNVSVLHPLMQEEEEEDDAAAATQQLTRDATRSSEPSLPTSQVKYQGIINSPNPPVVEEKPPQKLLQKTASDPKPRSRNEQIQQEKMREKAVRDLAKQLDNLEPGDKLAKAMGDPGKNLGKAGEKLINVWDHNDVQNEAIETKENVLDAQTSDSALWREEFRARMRCLAGGQGLEANLVAPNPAPPAASTPASGEKVDDLCERRDVSSDARAAFVAALQGCVHVIVSSVSSPSASCVPARAYIDTYHGCSSPCDDIVKYTRSL